ncbi:GNAT family N-acetyltransferase [Desulfopila sp. IMCC35006]|uniref:bifunctional acetyl-CoA hydrolase/transferase family protein/GNAT family N-acetyltransferase n=1 Tax=Desulfopila sp. IMCC35006 TaxID=2569542 RepID=UPI0010AC5FFD|nr:bifunctional acetyl-CoA hydrolase/transferase family protein/GNAT family N-acetyltransferase [Desulfopila sp. IMCC35006]TKB25103.1 GNAT family N-acetyltransferase [Desulfopila sp. IMCC35006]
MRESGYWADNYQRNKLSVQDAIAKIQSGQRIFIGSSCGEPQQLVKGLADASLTFTDLEIVRMFSGESTSLSRIAEKSKSQNLNIRSFYLGSANSESFKGDLRFITPINLSDIHKLIKSKMLPIQVALIQVTPPDDFGWMSLGISVDVTASAAAGADLVIAQVNSKMPRTLGRSSIHVNDIDYFVEHDETLIEIGTYPDVKAAGKIARYVSRLVEDGSTMQMSLGGTSEANIQALMEKNDLGIHTQYVTNTIMKLMAMGVVTNKNKGFNSGKIICSNAIGNQNLYDLLDYNSAVEFHPSKYVNDPRKIAKNRKMVAMNTAREIDLTGQVTADALPFNNFSGVTGILDFFRGAAMSKKGKSILMLTSTRDDGTRSRIVPILEKVAVVVPRSEVQYVVTEYGSVNLFGKSIQERALSLISIAHPDFRDELFEQAKDLGLLGPERILRDEMHSIYPLWLEETRIIDRKKITFRPVKLTDERSLQEHYYRLDSTDVISRFFHEKKSFISTQIERTFIIDYLKDLTIVAVEGQSGYERILAVGEYYLNPETELAEIAFSVEKEWQGKGLSSIVIQKLAEAARRNGIKGLTAYTAKENKRMVKLFHTLNYQVKAVSQGSMIYLETIFDQKQDPAE